GGLVLDHQRDERRSGARAEEAEDPPGDVAVTSDRWDRRHQSARRAVADDVGIEHRNERVEVAGLARGDEPRAGETLLAGTDGDPGWRGALADVDSGAAGNLTAGRVRAPTDHGP